MAHVPCCKCTDWYYCSINRDVHEAIQAEAETEAEAFRSEAEARPRHLSICPRRGRGRGIPFRGRGRGEALPSEVEASSRHLSTSTRPKPRPSRRPIEHCFWTGFNNTELISSFNILSFYFLINNNRQLPVPRMAHLNYTEAMIRTIQ